MKLEETYKELTKEWDEIAEERFKDLKNNLDVSYNEILKPELLKVLERCDLSIVLDVGCGVGVFTEELGRISKEVIGIDISNKSIEIAKVNSTHSNVLYKCLNFTDYNSDKKFTTIVANMALMTIPNIEDVLAKIKGILHNEGKLVFTITHPSFWPIYWNYTGNDFDYNREVEIVKEFKIRSKTYASHKTRHYHRPLSIYIGKLISKNLAITKFLELKENNDQRWYPRFLLVECKNVSFHF
jgi:2-polyprenyl-3-methyl-5-hydroxy-6-metoxy-1,4-benzoquinol methylase